jgi:PKD repeat protein
MQQKYEVEILANRICDDMWPRMSPFIRIFFMLSLFSTTTLAQISFVRRDISGTLNGAYGLYAIDMNKDGRIDILSASAEGAKWWRNEGNGSFENNEVGSLTEAWWVHGADVDGDGDIDVMAASPHPAEDRMRLWINQGNLTWKNPIDFPLSEAEAVHADHLDNDGLMEILGASWGIYGADEGNDLVYFTNYAATDPTKVVVDPNLYGAHAIATADFDGDGVIDIVASGASSINLYLNDGEGNFSRRYVTENEGALGFSLADVDRDGDLDIVSHGRNAGSVLWYERTSGLNFTPHTVGTDIGECWSAHAADLDGDGDMDIVAASITYNTIRAYINDGSQNFTKVTVTDDFPFARMEYPVDLDDDGDADIIGVAKNASTLAWFESISPIPRLRLTSPRGGENWEAGSAQNIEWRSNGDITRVKLEFSLDNGATWQVIAGNAANTGSYRWTVPDTTSSNGRVRISHRNNANTSDVSDSTFAIMRTRLTVTSPNGGEYWFVGTSQNITWNSTGLIGNVRLELSLDNGANWQTLVESAPNTGSYTWNIPTINSNTCLIRITDVADSSRFDVSDKLFTIGTPFITVTRPNGGESFFIGSTDTVKWKSAGPITQVKIEVSRNGGSTWRVLTESAPNDGAYEWPIGGMTSNNCLVRISDAADGAPIDSSDASFSIDVISITLDAPSGGEILDIGQLYTIRWTTKGPIPTVKLDYSIDDGATWLLLAEHLTNTGSYNWTVPNTLSTSCRIRIADDFDGSPVDMSDNLFAIANPNRLPVVDAGGPYAAPRGLPITFDASRTSDPDGDALSFRWDFGDGQFGAGVKTSHAYTTLQNYTIKLTVRDPRGGEATTTTTANIYNQAPIAHLAGPATGTVEDTVRFDASASMDADGDPLTYLWKFGDSSPNFTGGPQVSHVYSEVGSYRVVLRVQDNFGGQDEDTIGVAIRINLAPVVDISANEVNVYAGCSTSYPIVFRINQAYDTDGTIVRYAWNFGDGSPHSNSNSSLTHHFNVPGTYTVKLTVTDNGGAVGVDSVKISLTGNQPPVAAFTIPKDTVLVNTAVNFDASLSTDVDGNIIAYTWNFGDGTVISSPQATTMHMYQSAQTVEVTLTVIDACGKSGMAAKTLYVVLPTKVTAGSHNELPEGFALAQNLPNPVSRNNGKNTFTRIVFQLPKAVEVDLAIFNIFGQRLRTIAHGNFAPGNHTAIWDLRDDRGETVSTGIYFYRLHAEGFSDTKKLVITK